MMRAMSVVIVAVFPALTVHSAEAQSAAATPPLTRQPSAPFIGAARSPYQGIFDSPARRLQPQVTATAEPARSVVCGMTVIKGDPKLDARMLAQPKPGQSIAPKARIIEPKICR